MIEIFRYIALVLMIVALMLLGADAMAALQAHGAVKLHSLGDVWGLIHPASIAAVKTSLPASLVTAANALLGVPAWFVFGISAVVIAYLTRDRGDAHA